MRFRRSRPRPEPAARPGLWVGIDLGTTFSAVARVDEFGKPVVLPNRDGETLTASVVFFDGEQPLVGTMAKRSIVSSPLDVAQFVKRAMGDPSWRFETSRGTPYRPEEISALVLKRLKEDAERLLGAKVTDAVVTVPAYFGDAARRATIDAGTIAGLRVRRILNEPTAAALAYGLDGLVSGTVVVYDLGGGTFDVTALRIEDGDFRVLATHGDRNLGGFDFDNLLMRLLDERFVAAGGPSLLADDTTEAVLREKAELAKHTLTTVERTRVALAAHGFTHTVPLTRADFEDTASALLSRTRDITELVVEEAGLTWHGVDRILLAGGATRMPMVRRMLERVSGLTPDASANPDEIVALGAATLAQLLATDTDDGDGTASGMSTVAAPTVSGMRPVIRDVTSHGLGELVHKRGTRSTENRVIIPRNSPVPAEWSRVFHTRFDDQPAIRTSITEGDDTDPAHVRIIGQEDIEVPPYPKGAPFETTLAYDENQIIFVKVKDVTADSVVGTFEILYAQNLDGDQLARSAMRISAISPL
nr:Hsp70 family protein [Actinopolymorpha pittospori]